MAPDSRGSVACGGFCRVHGGGQGDAGPGQPRARCERRRAPHLAQGLSALGPGQPRSQVDNCALAASLYPDVQPLRQIGIANLDHRRNPRARGSSSTRRSTWGNAVATLSRPITEGGEPRDLRYSGRLTDTIQRPPGAGKPGLRSHRAFFAQRLPGATVALTGSDADAAPRAAPQRRPPRRRVARRAGLAWGVLSAGGGALARAAPFPPAGIWPLAAAGP